MYRVTVTISPTETPGLFRVIDTPVVSREPLLAVARWLAGQGWPERTVIEVRHRGERHVALRSTLGVAARLTVEDGRDGRPRFRTWKAPPRVGLNSPMRSRRRRVSDPSPYAPAVAEAVS
jgi:hypothetical protein